MASLTARLSPMHAMTLRPQSNATCTKKENTHPNKQANKQTNTRTHPPLGRRRRLLMTTTTTEGGQGITKKKDTRSYLSLTVGNDCFMLHVPYHDHSSTTLSPPPNNAVRVSSLSSLNTVFFRHFVRKSGHMTRTHLTTEAV